MDTVSRRGACVLSQRPPGKLAQPPVARRRVVAAHFRNEKSFPLHEGLPLSMFHPFTHLPADGTTLPIDEELCDIETTTCKTPRHVYEAKCTHCYGTGWVRCSSPGHRSHHRHHGHNGSHSHGHTCLLCHGLGYVRRTTSRFEPDDPNNHHTMVRPQAWQGPVSFIMPRQHQRQRRIGEKGSGAVEGNGSRSR